MQLSDRRQRLWQIYCLVWWLHIPKLQCYIEQGTHIHCTAKRKSDWAKDFNQRPHSYESWQCTQSYTAIAQRPIYWPADYVRIMEEARKNPKLYEVKYLDHTSLKDFSITSTLKSIWPGSKTDDPVVIDIKAMRYELKGEIWYKLNFSDYWKYIPMKRGESTEIKKTPSQLHSISLPIPASKYRHLQELKPYVRADLHAFYNSLHRDWRNHNL